MAPKRFFLVPIDFSRLSELALDHAIELAQESKANLILLHVITNQAVNLPLILWNWPLRS